MRQSLKVFLILFVFGLLVYANGLNNQFLWDDYLLLNNPDLSQTKYIFSQWDPNNGRFYQGYFRPLAHMVYAFCYGSFKDHYWQYHLLNLFFLALLCVLVYLLLYRLTGNLPLAFLSGLFFLIHPINGIMVNNIVTNALSLEMIFIIGAVLLLWESLEKNYDRGFYYLGLLVSFLSLFWYDMGMMAPLYSASVVLIFRKEAFKFKLIYIFPFFFISFSYFCFKHFFLHGNPFLTTVTTFHLTAGQYLATLSLFITWYLMKLVFLHGIVMQWVAPAAHGGLFWPILELFGLFALFVFSLLRWSKEKILVLALSWIFISLSPVVLLGFSNPEVGAFIEPHWFVFASLGFFILLACFCLFLISRVRMVGVLVLFVLVFAFSASSRAYNEIWKDEKSYALFWSQQVPNLKFIDTVLGDAYKMEGNFRESRKYYRLSNHGFRINPVSCNAIGIMDMQEHHWKKAEDDFKLALSINLHFAPAYCNLGSLYFMQNKMAKASSYFFQALVYDPLIPAARIGLARIALVQSRYKDAVAWCLKNLDITKDDPDTLILLTMVYTRQNDFTDARQTAGRLISLYPDDQPFKNYIAKATGVKLE